MAATAALYIVGCHHIVVATGVLQLGSRGGTDQSPFRRHGHKRCTFPWRVRIGPFAQGAHKFRHALVLAGRGTARGGRLAQAPEELRAIVQKRQQFLPVQLLTRCHLARIGADQHTMRSA